MTNVSKELDQLDGRMGYYRAWSLYKKTTALTWVPVAEFVERIEAQGGRLVLARINDE
jgi:hypothetical protein